MEQDASTKAILIAGPTASGKSSLAVRLAEKLNGWVINADSLQVYDGWRVLTARPDEADLSRAPHHLYGHVDPSERYSVGKWLSDLNTVLQHARAAGAAPIIVGGTGLYFTALTRGLSDIPAIPERVRQNAIDLQNDMGTLEFQRALLSRDPKAAQLDIENPRRALRAWEVYEATGQSLVDWSAKPTTPLLAESHIHAKLVLDMERDTLVSRINTRFVSMTESGALDETIGMRQRKIDPSLPAMRAVGAPPLFAHLDGDLTLPEAIERGTIDTKRYAKRQRTWLRNQMSDWEKTEATTADNNALINKISLNY